MGACEHGVFLPANETTGIFTSDDIELFYLNGSGRNLEFVPEPLRTKKVCMIAVENDGTSLSFVPKEILNKDIIFRALENEPNAILLLEQQYRTPDIKLFFVEKNNRSVLHMLEGKDDVDEKLIFIALEGIIEKTGVTTAQSFANILYNYIKGNDALIYKIQNRLKDSNNSTAKWNHSMFDGFSEYFKNRDESKFISNL